MEIVQRINLLTGTALIAALLGLFIATVHIDIHARQRYLVQKGAAGGALSVQRRASSGFSERKKVKTHVVEADVGKEYHKFVNATIEYIYQYFQDGDAQVLSIQVSSDNATMDNPVLIVVREQKGVLSWQLPLILEASSGLIPFNHVSRTLCPDQGNQSSTISGDYFNSASSQEFFVGVSTSNPTNTSFRVHVEKVENFVLSMDSNYTVMVTASEPKYYQFNFPEGVSNVLLSVTSEDDTCMSISIQNLGCPVFDTDRDLKYEGIWQTMMNKTGMTINRERFPNGFFIVFVVKADDYECTGSRERQQSRIKTLNLSIREKVSYVNFMLAVIGVLGVFALFYVITFITFCLRCTNHHVPDELEPSLLEIEQAPGIYGSFSTPIVGSSSTALPRSRSVQSLDMSDIDLLPDAYSDKEVIRTKTFLFVADLARKGSRFHGKKTQLYMWNLIIVAVFYALPVLQLVIIYQKVLNDTGDQDLCYYNFLCSQPLGQLTDFNHFYSNLGYIMLGLLFIILTARRDVLRRKAQQRHDRLEKYYGIPQHYGLFYAMGTALMVEGVLSACYHICPTHANYQFDTTFMYVISMLCMLKIYQTRHPDINADAHAAFAVLAFVVLLGVVSVFEDNTAFRVIFAGLHLLSCLALSAQVYYMGRWKLNLGIFKRIYLVCWNDFQAGPSNWFRPMYVDRMFLLVIGILTNIGLDVYGMVERPTDFASYILAIFITNLMLYTMFYIIMKLRHGERIHKMPLLFIALSTVSWAAAMYFFINKAITWRKRAAESRLFNHECLVLNFYDFHDIWHFLSAASLFFSFMILLTLDDDLVYTPRDKIPVF